MSPKNKPSDIEFDELEEFAEIRRAGPDELPVSPARRSKRIRGTRRPLAPNGIQRRRNKRVGW